MTAATLPLLSESPRPVAAHLRILALAWGAWTTGFYSLMLWSFLLKPIREAFALSDGQLANLTAVGIGATGVGGLLFGWMSDRLGRRPSLAVGIAAFSLGNAACGLAGGPAALFAARAVAGLGIGGTWGAGQALLGETFPPRLRSRYGAIAQTGAPVGLGLAAVVGSFVAPSIGWRVAFLASAAPALALLFYRELPESDVWLEHRRRTSTGGGGSAADAGAARGPGGAGAAGSAGGAGGAGGAEGAGAAEAAGRGRPILAQLVAPDLAGLFSRAFLLTALNMSAYWFAIIWLPRYLQEQRKLSIFGSGWWTLVFVAGSLTGYLTFAWVSDGIGRRRAFALYSATTALGLAMVSFFWDLLEHRPLALLGCMLIAGLGTGTWSCYGPFFSELFPTRVRGAAMSVIMNVTRGVQFAAPLVIAGVAGRWGLGGGVALAAGFALLAGAWVWTLPETAGSRIEI